LPRRHELVTAYLGTLIRLKTGSKNSLAPPQKESEIQAADARPQPSLTLINEALDHSEQ
jgi:hypothetical protein